jgi:hypothetical protein
VRVRDPREEKIVHSGFTFRRGSGRSTVGKIERVGAPHGGREPSGSERSPKVPGRFGGNAGFLEGRKGASDERDIVRGRFAGRPEGSESPRKQQPPPRRKKLGSVKGDGSSEGRKSLRRRFQAERFGKGARERREGRETLSRSFDGRKALKGKAQECWELKEASEGRRG